MAPSARSLFSLLFFLSGAAGLVYEVCWTRLLILPMGSTVHSLTAVLTAFMGGLALGAFLAGRWIDRGGRPLRVYATLEAGIGVFCFVLPWIVAAEQPLFRWVYQNLATHPLAFHLFKFFACGLVILVPATLMGATLPVLCRYFMDDRQRIGRSLGWLYAVNAFGAVAGSLLAGFVLIPQLGLRGAMLVGVATSLTVAAIAWLVQSRFPARSARDTPADAVRAQPAGTAASHPTAAAGSAASRRLATVLLLGYGISGLAAMLFQIAWTRVLVLVVGSSVYALALVVSAFILGLAVGSSVASRIVDRLRNPTLAFALAELGIGLSALAMVPVFQRFPEWMLRLVPQLSQNFWSFQLVQFGLIFLALLLPTACMGMCLPLVGRAVMRDAAHVGETVGTAYSANTVGTILGAFCGGFVFLPHLGVNDTIRFGALLNILVAVIILGLGLPRRSGRLAAAAAIAVGVLAAIFVPRFDPATLTSGAFLYAERYRQHAAPGRSLADILRQEYSILLYEEGLGSTITVKEGPSGSRYLAINGKVDGSDDKDMSTQVLSGHVSCLLHPEPRDVAVIGLATGVTLHAVAQHPSVRRIDCIEIVPEMTRAAELFTHVNGGVLRDPRLHLILQDARNHLSLTRQEYDLVISEPSNPWMAGVASLYTREFLTSCRTRLRPHGIMVVFLHLYSMDMSAFRGLVRTFQEVFPSASLWETAFGSDYVLVGTKDELAIRWVDLQQRMREPHVARHLASVDVHDVRGLLQRFLAGPQALRAFTGEGVVYTDDRNRLEFDAPRFVYQTASLEDLQRLHALTPPGLPDWLQLPPDGLPASMDSALAAGRQAQEEFWLGMTSKARGRPREATAHFVAALERDPWLPGLTENTLEATRAFVEATREGGNPEAVIALYERIVRLHPQSSDFHNRLGSALGNAGRVAEAEAAFARALELQPRNLTSRTNLALALARQGKYGKAAEHLRAVVAQRPTDVAAHIHLTNLALQTGDLTDAEQHAEAATKADPRAAEAWFALGEVLVQKGEYRPAVPALEKALALGAQAEHVRPLLEICRTGRRES